MEGKAVEIFRKAYNLTKINAVRILGQSFQDFFEVKNQSFETLICANEGTLCSNDIEFDFLVSNPPYISQREYENLDRQVVNFESKTALVSKEDGFYHTRKLLEWGYAYLKKGGFVCLELDPIQINTLQSHLKDSKLWRISEIVNDMFGIVRFIVIHKL